MAEQKQSLRWVLNCKRLFFCFYAIPKPMELTNLVSLFCLFLSGLKKTRKTGGNTPIFTRFRVDITAYSHIAFVTPQLPI